MTVTTAWRLYDCTLEAMDVKMCLCGGVEGAVWKSGGGGLSNHYTMPQSLDFLPGALAMRQPLVPCAPQAQPLPVAVGPPVVRTNSHSAEPQATLQSRLAGNASKWRGASKARRL
eukprot:360076-Chlamydomonas_euryale.AAC.3